MAQSGLKTREQYYSTSRKSSSSSSSSDVNAQGLFSTKLAVLIDNQNGRVRAFSIDEANQCFANLQRKLRQAKVIFSRGKFVTVVAVAYRFSTALISKICEFLEHSGN